MGERRADIKALGNRLATLLVAQNIEEQLRTADINELFKGSANAKGLEKIDTAAQIYNRLSNGLTTAQYLGTVPKEAPLHFSDIQKLGNCRTMGPISSHRAITEWERGHQRTGNLLHHRAERL
jgi:hypothetical protein